MESDAALVPEDSTYVSSVLQNQQNIQKIELDDLIDLEKDLSIGEKIGVIFLLYGSDQELVNAAIQHILYILRNPLSESTFIYQWAKGRDTWQEPLVESLCITQSYHITEKLNLHMKLLEEVYMPYRCGVALSINQVVKSLFLMAERLLIKDTEMLIQYMADKGTTNFSDHNYIELHLLDWIRRKIIEVHESVKVDVLYEFLKQCELHDALEPLESFRTKVISVEKKSALSSHNSSDCYKIRREKCGYVLIINQKTFTKPDPAQIPPGVEIEECLSDRNGTDADCVALERAFSVRGYKIVRRDNLTHIQLQKALHDIVQASTIYDSLVVCILSHGNKGVVFGSDYIPVNITTIQEILSTQQLLNKPKVLIIQACQGRKKNVTITSERTRSDLETDDASHQAPVSAPKYADLLTAMSTIEGFVSIRDRKRGTWYIQEVCKSIEERGDEEHILDLLTNVNNKVAQKRHLADEEELCMLPEFSVRLLKKMYLPKKICEGVQQ
ncbi:caspase-8 [Culicoides brevitarsis]|uniref:caspase-8 n=1 Tax=Culicoides brevitarsis TaxID=469753 RepID=UPI00307C1F19